MNKVKIMFIKGNGMDDKILIYSDHSIDKGVLSFNNVIKVNGEPFPSMQVNYNMTVVSCFVVSQIDD